MTRGLADTTMFIARESGRALDESKIPSELSVSVVTIGELRAGVLATSDVVIRNVRLTTLTTVMSFDPGVISDEVAEQWARPWVLLRDSHQRMPVNESLIAATAMALDVPVVTQDDGYIDLDELRVIQV